MKYLLFLQDGFVKKHPLTARTLTLGRSAKNDIVIDERFVSRCHARLTLRNDTLEIIDCNSTNGVYVDCFRKKKAEIPLNHCFRIGHMDFIFKQGDPAEFELSPQTRQVLSRVTEIKRSAEETRRSLNLFDKTLVYTLEWGFRVTSFKDILEKTRQPLEITLQQGSIYLVCPGNDNGSLKILSSMDIDHPPAADPAEIIDKTDIWSKETVIRKNGGLRFVSFPVELGTSSGALVYVFSSNRRLEERIICFLRDLAHELSIIFLFIEKNNAFKNSPKSRHPIVLRNPEVTRILERCRKVAAGDISVLIQGETGTGKELIARFIHNNSKRKSGQYVAINCSAIPETLLESMLFGHDRGAFTDASEAKTGKLELASGGTLVLDEIGDMPLNLQAKILRVLQEGEYYPLGKNEPVKVDLRIIALTNKDITDLVEQKKFRQDLFYRIAHFDVTIPPLRNRKEDIIPIFSHFLEKYTRQEQKNLRGVSRETIDALLKYNWPGNVRQLENKARLIASIAANGELVTPELLGREITGTEPNQPLALSDSGGDDRNRLLMVLEKNHWNKSSAAQELGISRTALYKKMQRFQISY